MSVTDGDDAIPRKNQQAVDDTSQKKIPKEKSDEDRNE